MPMLVRVKTNRFLAFLKIFDSVVPPDSGYLEKPLNWHFSKKHGFLLKFEGKPCLFKEKSGFRKIEFLRSFENQSKNCYINLKGPKNDSNNHF